ncbi:MAG: cytochrome c biogenesis protein CcsA [Actinomycetia bacterium]|nr:cytochrome c biogenesis protein CcsA [Actinomycetes bacterium]
MEIIFHNIYLASFALYVVAWFFSLLRLLKSKSFYLRIIQLLLLLSLSAETIYLGWRWIRVNHPPLFGTFENTLASAWFLGIFVIIINICRNNKFKGLDAFILPWGIAALLWGSRFRVTLFPLTISELSWWLDIHVLFAWLAYPVFILSFSCSLAFLIKLYLENRGYKVEGLPDLDILDDLNFKAITYAFVFFSIMLAVGSWYYFILMGDWYAWEVVGLFSGVAWLVYGLIIHVRLFFGWHGKKFAIITSFPVLLIFLAYWIWSVFPGTYHSFDFFIIKAL